MSLIVTPSPPMPLTDFSTSALARKPGSRVRFLFGIHPLFVCYGSPSMSLITKQYSNRIIGRNNVGAQVSYEPPVSGDRTLSAEPPDSVEPPDSINGPDSINMPVSINKPAARRLNVGSEPVIQRLARRRGTRRVNTTVLQKTKQKNAPLRPSARSVRPLHSAGSPSLSAERVSGDETATVFRPSPSWLRRRFSRQTHEQVLGSVVDIARAPHPRLIAAVTKSKGLAARLENSTPGIVTEMAAALCLFLIILAVVIV